jgi:hypothetical protein
LAQASSKRPRNLDKLRTALGEGGENLAFLKLDVDETSALPGKLGPSPPLRGSPHSALRCISGKDEVVGFGGLVAG